MVVGTMRVGAMVVLLAAASSEAEPEADGIQRLAWLQGCWRASSGDRTVEEFWMAPRGGSMVGMSRTVLKGALAEYELVVVRERDHRLVYLAHPSGQPSAEFLSASGATDRIVFENAGHDFPQRIGYERKGAELHAWVEGAKKGRTRRIEFQYRRAVCPGD